MGIMKNYNFITNGKVDCLIKCSVLAFGYVGSLYINKSNQSRDHPDTIKQRTKSVVIVSLLAPFFIYYNSTLDNSDNARPIHVWLGLHYENFLNALFLPLLLTIILFLGPLTLSFMQDGFMQTLSSCKDGYNFNKLIWYRTYVVAPLTEEFIFRACMLPFLIPTFGLNTSILIAPLFFGVAHFHHIIEQLRSGQDFFPVLISSLFQMTYTTIFGAYSAFLFLRTGHLIGPVVCHSFCNMMGFPEFHLVGESEHPKFIWVMFILGLLLFTYLLYPLTSPSLFGSSYWV